VNSLIRLAILREPGSGAALDPEISYYSGQDVGGMKIYILNEDERETARDYVLKSFRWCAERFFMCTGRVSAGVQDQSIIRIVIGKTHDERSFLSASSMQVPGEIQVALPSKLGTILRFGSTIAHENMHQALYVRELIENPVRKGALGYSPWKKSLRSGRWLWHSFWTFSCQFALISESLLRETEIVKEDPDLIPFLADMASSIFFCANFLKDYNIVSTAELERCLEAEESINKLCQSLGFFPSFERELKKAIAEVDKGFVAWGEQLIIHKKVTI
jgi:hypothetical protein